MSSQKRYRLKRGFWLLLVLLLLWKSVPTAIYFLVEGVYNFPTIFMSLLGIVVLVVFIEGSALKKIERKELQLLEIILPFLLITAVVLLDLEDALTLTRVASTGYLFWRIQYIGVIIIFIALIWSLVISLTADRENFLQEK